MSSLKWHLTATALLAMLAVKGSMMKPSRSLMFTKVRLAVLSSELKVYLWQAADALSAFECHGGVSLSYCMR